MFTETSKLPSGSEIQVGLGTITGIGDFDIPLTKYGGGMFTPHMEYYAHHLLCKTSLPSKCACVRACVRWYLSLTHPLLLVSHHRYWYLCKLLVLVLCVASHRLLRFVCLSALPDVAQINVEHAVILAVSNIDR